MVVGGDTDTVDAKGTIPPADDTSISGGEAIPIGPFELQIASKPHLRTQTDVEDAFISPYHGRNRLSIPRHQEKPEILSLFIGP